MLIQRFRVENFKGFEEAELRDCARINVFVGPNNSGKTNFLQAIALWHACLRKWVQKRLEKESKAHKRRAVSISAQELLLPVPDPLEIWHMKKAYLSANDFRKVGKEPKAGSPRYVNLLCEGEIAIKKERLAFSIEVRIRHGGELIYADVRSAQKEEVLKEVAHRSVVYLPPFFGLLLQEPRHDDAYQERRLWEGLAGQVLRNILLDLKNSREEAWEILIKAFEETFGMSLEDPSYRATPANPYVEAKFVTDGVKLDLSALGSGALQFLGVVAVLLRRKASIALVDEPDAHAHPNLSETIFRALMRQSSGTQFFMTTHSESTLRVVRRNLGSEKGTRPSIAVFAFFPKMKPRRLDTKSVQRAERALVLLSVHEIAQITQVPSVLYLEGDTDLAILKAWTKTLRHPLGHFLETGLVYILGGSNKRKIQQHTYAVKAVAQHARCVALLDRNTKADLEEKKKDLLILRWKRAEIENYLLVPSAIKRVVCEELPPLLANAACKRVDEWFARLPSEENMRERILANSPASKDLLPEILMPSSESPTILKKSEYYRIAEAMEPDEIHPDVKEMLDKIYKKLRLEEYYGELGSAL